MDASLKSDDASCGRALATPSPVAIVYANNNHPYTFTPPATSARSVSQARIVPLPTMATSMRGLTQVRQVPPPTLLPPSPAPSPRARSVLTPLYISDLRACRVRELEEKRINREMAHIRTKFKDGNLDGYQKKKYLAKVVFTYILGYKVDVGHMEAVNLISSPKYSEKQIVSDRRDTLWCSGRRRGHS